MKIHSEVLNFPASATQATNKHKIELKKTKRKQKKQACS